MSIIPLIIVAVSLLLVAVALFRFLPEQGQRRRCHHPRTRLHQIEYGGGYIEVCLDCGHQKYINR